MITKINCNNMCSHLGVLRVTSRFVFSEVKVFLCNVQNIQDIKIPKSHHKQYIRYLYTKLKKVNKIIGNLINVLAYLYGGNLHSENTVSQLRCSLNNWRKLTKTEDFFYFNFFFTKPIYRANRAYPICVLDIFRWFVFA